MNAVPARALAVANAPDDAALVQRVCGGDTVAFELLMRRHNRRLYRIARALLRDTAEAEDALQEAYLSAYRALPAFRAEAAVATWLGRIVVNECMDRLRRNARRGNIVSLAPADDEGEAPQPAGIEADTPEQALARGEMRVLLERCIDALPQEFRAVFVLRAVQELSVEETAASLGIPEATVRTRHFRARGLLRAAIARGLENAARDVFDFDGARCDRVVAGVLGRCTA